jgi:hypothetical protein
LRILDDILWFPDADEALEDGFGAAGSYRLGDVPELADYVENG